MFSVEVDESSLTSSPVTTHCASGLFLLTIISILSVEDI